MGVILYILISGSPPFYGPHDLAIQESVLKGKFEFDRIGRLRIDSPDLAVNLG